MRTHTHTHTHANAHTHQHTMYLRAKQKHSFSDATKSLLCTRFAHKLHKPLPSRLATFINHNHSSLQITKLCERLLQQLIWHKWVEILHFQGCTMSSKSDTQCSSFALKSIQGCFGCFCILAIVLQITWFKNQNRPKPLICATNLQSALDK